MVLRLSSIGIASITVKDPGALLESFTSISIFLLPLITALCPSSDTVIFCLLCINHHMSDGSFKLISS